MKWTGVIFILRRVGHWNALPMGARIWLITSLYRSEYSPSEPFEVGFFGFRYPGNLNCFIDWHVYFFGVHERSIVFLLRDLLATRTHKVFLDVGANVGHHSLFMARYASHVHAFEPWEKVRRAIVEKINLNGLTNISVHPVALGEKTESLPYYYPLGANTGTGSFSPNHATDRNRLLGNLDIANGDEYLKSSGIDSVGLIKIDAEGWERYVLLGLAETITRERPIILMEVSATTLASFANEGDFRACIPLDYEALYVRPGAEGVSFAEFDLSQPGDVLLRPRT